MIQKIKSSLTKKQNEITKTYKSQISNCISMLPGDWNGPPDESFSFQFVTVPVRIHYLFNSQGIFSVKENLKYRRCRGC